MWQGASCSSVFRCMCGCRNNCNSAASSQTRNNMLSGPNPMLPILKGSMCTKYWISLATHLCSISQLQAYFNTTDIHSIAAAAYILPLVRLIIQKQLYLCAYITISVWFQRHGSYEQFLLRQEIVCWEKKINWEGCRLESQLWQLFPTCWTLTCLGQTFVGTG